METKSIPKNVDTDWIIIICVCYTVRMQSCIILKIYITTFHKMMKLVCLNYRPVSNLQYISKLAESAVAKQLQHHIDTNNLFPMLQSSYCKFHSTESALLKVKNDILLNMNIQHVTLLVLLDLSAALDTIDHGILLERLRSAFGGRDTALSWIASYLSGRTQQVSIDGTLSMKFDLECGVPQGSCLGLCCLLSTLARYLKL